MANRVKDMHAVTGVVYTQKNQPNPRALAKCEMRHKAQDRASNGPANGGGFSGSHKRDAMKQYSAALAS